MLTLILSAILFLLGVVVATLSSFTLPFWVFIFATGLFIWKPRVGALSLAFLLGFARLSVWQTQTSILEKSESVNLLGKLTEDWGKKDGEWSWLVETERGVLLVHLSAYENLHVGQKFSFEGRVETLSDYTDNVSYQHYLQRHTVWGIMDKPQAQLLNEPEWGLSSLLSYFSEFLSLRLQILLPEPEASFAIGLLLGRRQNMDAHLQEVFQAVGLTHIVAISGSNIALVVLTIFAFFSFLPFRQRLFFSGVGVILFVILVGASAAVLRAGLMGILSLVGLYTGRRSQAFFGLLWSAILMVLWNPLVLVYDVGFQLSFAATLGILTLVPVLDSFFPKLPFRENLVLTLAAQIMTFPFIAFYFGRFSWVTFPANVMVAPLIPLAMGFSALALIFGPPAAALAWVFLWLIEKIALLWSVVPGAQWELTLSSGGFVFLLLSLILFLLLFYKSKWVRALHRGHEVILSMELNHEYEKHETQ